MTTETIATYDFDEDALGFGTFISETMDSLKAGEEVVYVNDHNGNRAKYARFRRETLTDGSTVVDLIISFED